MICLSLRYNDKKSPRLAGGIQAVLNLIKYLPLWKSKKILNFFKKKDLTTWKIHDKLSLSLSCNDKHIIILGSSFHLPNLEKSRV